MRTEIQPLPDPGADPSYNIQHMGDCVIFRMQIVCYILYVYTYLILSYLRYLLLIFSTYRVSVCLCLIHGDEDEDEVHFHLIFFN